MPTFKGQGLYIYIYICVCVYIHHRKRDLFHEIGNEYKGNNKSRYDKRKVEQCIKVRSEKNLR
jgi:hypothetical protein